jgi:hypothetical protein
MASFHLFRRRPAVSELIAPEALAALRARHYPAEADADVRAEWERPAPSASP